MFDELEKKNNKNIDFKEIFPTKFYNDLIKANFIDDLKEMTSDESLINVDIEDIKILSNSLLVGTLSQSFDKIDINYNINIINELEPTDCIVNISCQENANINEINTLLDKIKDLYPGINILFGIKIIPTLEHKFKIQSLFTFHEAVNNSKYDNENDLLYAIMTYAINNNHISINQIQQEFSLGFNRASNLIYKLEELKIISEKENTNPRKILINDLNKIKEIIYK